MKGTELYCLPLSILCFKAVCTNIPAVWQSALFWFSLPMQCSRVLYSSQEISAAPPSANVLFLYPNQSSNS